MEAAERALRVSQGLGRRAGCGRGRGAVRGERVDEGVGQRLAGGDALPRFIREAALQEVRGR